jgi:hypothetical protein
MMQRRLFLAAAGALVVATQASAAARPDEAYDVDAFLLLRAYQSFVEEHLSGLLRAMRAIARTSDAQSAEWEKIRPALYELGEHSPTYASTWFAPADGAYYSVATDGPTGLSISDRAYFGELLQGRDIEGELVVHKLNGRPTIIVATPVLAGEKVVGAIGAAIDGAMLSEFVETSTGLPKDLTFYAFDETGTIAIHRDVSQLGIRQAELGSPTLTAAIAEMLAKPSGMVQYHFADSDRTAVYNKSYATKWTFTLARIRNGAGR